MDLWTTQFSGLVVASVGCSHVYLHSTLCTYQGSRLSNNLITHLFAVPTCMSDLNHKQATYLPSLCTIRVRRRQYTSTSAHHDITIVTLSCCEVFMHEMCTQAFMWCVSLLAVVLQLLCGANQLARLWPYDSHSSSASNNYQHTTAKHV